MTEEEAKNYQIPKGYVALKVGDVRQMGDYYWSPHAVQWLPTNQPGEEIEEPLGPVTRYIRYDLSAFKTYQPTQTKEFGTW